MYAPTAFSATLKQMVFFLLSVSSSPNYLSKYRQCIFNKTLLTPPRYFPGLISSAENGSVGWENYHANYFGLFIYRSTLSRRQLCYILWVLLLSGNRLYGWLQIALEPSNDVTHRRQGLSPFCCHGNHHTVPASIWFTFHLYL